MTDEQIEALCTAVRERLTEIEDSGYTWADALADCLREPGIYGAPRLLAEGSATDGR